MNNTINFTDIIKNSVLNANTFGNISIIGVIIGLIMAYVVGMLIFLVYRKAYRGVVYSFTFNYALVLMTMITALIIMTISSNIVLSLGMVGALSIVRFRTAIKDPMDIVYMFWAISAGIATGAGIYPIAIIGSIMISLAILSMDWFKSKQQAYILVINHSEEAHEGIKAILNRFDYQIKSKAIKNGQIELTIEMKLPTENTTFVSDISALAGVRDAILVQYNTDYAQ